MALALSIIAITLSIFQITNIIIDRVFPQTQQVIIQNPEVIALGGKLVNDDNNNKISQNRNFEDDDAVELEGADSAEAS